MVATSNHCGSVFRLIISVRDRMTYMHGILYLIKKNYGCGGGGVIVCVNKTSCNHSGPDPLS